MAVRVADARDAVGAAYRSEWARVVSTLIRITGDWSLAEDCTAEAFETALARPELAELDWSAVAEVTRRGE